MRLSRGGASVSITEQNGLLYVQDLIGSDARDMVALIRAIRDKGERQNLYFPLKDGDDYKGLRRLAERVGATKELEVWKL